jgi:arginine decarboxylase
MTRAQLRADEMLIKITSAVASGPTALGAFDAALQKAGIENYNLIPLSSVIPPGATLERGRFRSRSSEYGHRLYVVIARHDSAQVGEEAWAGLGWTQEPESGRGLFVELHGTSRRSVEVAIESTLDSMKQGRPYEYGKNEREVAGIVCDGDPVCAVVVAVYTSEPWSS